MNLKNLQSSDAVIRALGDFSTEIMAIMHNRDGMSVDDEKELRGTLAAIHALMARIGESVS